MKAPASERRVFQCWVPFLIPSKKNGKMLTRGRIITNPTTQRLLGQVKLLYQSARAAQGVERMTNCKVAVTVGMIKKSSDLDNVLTSVLDCLKDAGVIANDSAKHVTEVCCSLLAEKGEDRVGVTVSGENTRIKS